jgi:transcriptional regulator with XRE-family HTH domain
MQSSPTARVAGNVRAEMGRQNVTQVQLAGAMSLTQAAISRRLTGKVPFNVQELADLAVFLDVPVSRLTEGLDAREAVA